jgi:hypothetical protein
MLPAWDYTWRACDPTQPLTTSNRGFFGQGDMQKEFEEASFALKPGEISPVIETASGLHLIERYVTFTPAMMCGLRLTPYALHIPRRGCAGSGSSWHARSRVHDQ